MSTDNDIQPGKNVDVTVSPCKGNFTIISPGSTQATAKVKDFTGKTLTLKYSYDKSNPNFPLYLNPNDEHFINFKWKNAEYDTLLGSASFQAKFYFERVQGTDPNGPNCTDESATQYFNDEPVRAVGIKNSDVVSLKFSSTKILLGKEQIRSFQFVAPIESFPQATVYEYCISECKGSFVPPKNNNPNNPNCKGNTSSSSTSIFTTIPNTLNDAAYGTPCLLEKNKNYYLNIRTKDPSTGLGTCSDPAGCSVGVFLGYREPVYVGPGEENPGIPTCPSFSGKLVKWEGSQVKLTPFTNDSVISIEIDTEKYPLLKSSRSYKISWVNTSDIKTYAELEVAISTCPGDFNSSEVYGSRCEAHYYPPGTLNVSLGKSQSPLSVCELPASTKKIYANFRRTKTDGTGAGSCEVASCPVWVNISR